MDGVFLMVVLIVLISCSTGVAGRYIRLRQRELDARADDDLVLELRDVKDRVATLEKIVTDRKFSLADEIADLERK